MAEDNEDASTLKPGASPARERDLDSEEEEPAPTPMPEPAPTPMPEALRARARAATMRGFMTCGSTSPSGVNMICAARGILGMLFGFTLFQFFSAASTRLGAIAHVVLVVIGPAGTIMATTNVRPLWQEFVVGWPTRKTSETTDPPMRRRADPPMRRPADGLTDSYLETLLLTPLSEGGVAQVEQHLQGVPRIVRLKTVGIFVITAASMVGSLAATGSLDEILGVHWTGSSQTNTTDGTVEDASSDGLATTLTWIAGVVTLFIYAPMVGVQNTSVVFAKQLACSVTKDMADQITAQIRRSTAATLDFDEITSQTYRLHL